MFWLARNKMPKVKMLDVYASINNSHLFYLSCFPHSISLIKCGVCQVFMNALEPLTIIFVILLNTIISTFILYMQMKTSCVQIDPSISEKVCSLK